LCGLLSGKVGVLQAELHRVDGGGLGQPIHHAFDEERRLRIPVTAHGAGDRVVGVDAIGLELDVGDSIQGGGRLHHHQRGDGPPGDVGADVEQGAHGAERQAAVTARAGAHLNVRRLPHGRGTKLLRAREGQTHRPGALARQQRRDRLEGVDVEAAAERAADGGLQDSNLTAVQV